LEGKEALISSDVSKILFDHLNPKRWDDRQTTLELIWLSKQLGLTDADVHAYCKQSSKYDNAWVQEIIDSRRDECPFSIGTLIYYLKQDVDKEMLNKILPKDNTYTEIKEKRSNRRTPEEAEYLKYIKNEILTKQIKSLFDYKENHNIKIENISKDVEYVKDIVFPPDVRCIGLHAGLGRGKTSSIIRLVKSMPSNARILILSPRITFSKNICKEYNSQLDESRQFNCYLKNRKEGTSLKQLNFQNKVVMSMEGIHYLEHYTPDLLIVDECNANLISHVSPETNGRNLDNNLYQFRRMLKSSKQVIVADAFLGSKVTNFFTDLDIPLHVYKYNRKLDRKKAIFLQPIDKDMKKVIKKSYEHYPDKVVKYKNHLCFEGQAFKKVQELLDEEKKVYAFISTRSDLERYQDALNDKYNCEFYSGVSQNEIPDNLNTTWSEKDLVANTSTITVGINHDRKDVFYTKIIDFKASSNNYVSDAVQSHYRVRNIIADHIYVAVEDNPIASNYPINMKAFDENSDHKTSWFQMKYGGYSKLETYAHNLVKHNYLEHQLSNVASTKMMRHYLEDCNYEIVDEGINKSKDDVTENSEDMTTALYEDENMKRDLIKEFVDNCPTQIRVMELEKDKLTRKLSQKERDEIDKFWFINIYTGGTQEGYRDVKMQTIALAYSLWSCRFNGKRTFKSMRLEKRLLEGKITIKEVAEERWDKSQYSDFQSSDIIKIQRVIYVCNKLGLKHCNDTDTIIPQERMDEFYDDAQTEYENIQKDMGIQDQRTKKGSKIVTQRQFKGCIESVFTQSEHSLCNLSVVGEKRVTKNGKRAIVRSYGLVPNKEIKADVELVNQSCDFEKYNIQDINIKETPKLLYENLDIDEKKHKRLL
jgi:hypothetical protein